MINRKRRFAALDRGGKRRISRKASTRKIAGIDAVLKANEIDMFAGMAADLYDDLARTFDDHLALIEDAQSHQVNVKRALNAAKDAVASANAQIKAFNAFEKTMMKDETLNSPLRELADALNSKISDAEQEVRFQTQQLEMADAELEEALNDPLYLTLVDNLEQLDQDDTLEGLTSFSSGLADVVSDIGDDFLMDILGSSDGSRMLDFMDRIGL